MLDSGYIVRRELAHVRATLSNGQYGERRDNEQRKLRVAAWLIRSVALNSGTQSLRVTKCPNE